MDKFDNVSVTKKANVYFDGKCVSAPDSATWNGWGGKGRRTAANETGNRGTASAPAPRLAPSESQPYTVHLADGSRKSIGVIFPAQLTFKTAEPETMEIVAGSCRAKLPGESEWRTYLAGQSFKVPANASFDIEALEPLDYVCHFG